MSSNKPRGEDPLCHSLGLVTSAGVYSCIPDTMPNSRTQAQEHPTTPAADAKYIATARAFAEWTYLLWRDAWRDIVASAREASRAAGVPMPAAYGNSANQAMAIIESP